MYIHRLTASFGRLDHQTLTLAPGLNILKAPNETGKSTWCAFLAAMLYGVSSRERDRAGALADKNRYMPWNGQPMQGRMELVSGGSEITVLRETRRAAAPMAEFSACYTGTGDAVPGLTGQNCGETLLGVPLSVYERSALIRQTGLGVTQDAELEKRILSLITSGEEDASFADVSAALKKQLNRRRHNQTGELPRMEEALAGLDRRMAEMAQLRTELDSVSQEQARTAGQRADCERRLSALAQYQSAQKKSEFQAAQTAADAAQERADNLKSRLERERIPENETIARLRGAIVNLETTRKNVAVARAKRDKCAKALLRAEAAVNDGPFAGMTVEDAKRDADAPFPDLSLPIRILPLLYAVYGAVFLWLNRTFFHLSYPLQLLCGLIPCGIVVYAMISARRKVKKAQEVLLKRFGTTAPSEIVALAEAYGELCADRDAAKSTAIEAKTAADTLYAALCENEQAILLEVRRFAPAAFDISSADEALRACAVRRRELLDAERAAQNAALRCELLFKQLPPETAAQNSVDAETPPPRENVDSLKEQLSALTQQCSALQSRADRLSGQLSALGSPDDLAEEKRQLTARRDTCQREYDALALALDALQSANTTLQGRFSPALGRRAAEIFSALTDGRYGAVTLDRTFHLSAEPAGDVLPRDAQFLSTGALDQLYLAVRLAICEMVLPGDDPAPIILDDALANFDDERCALALKWLLKESHQRQILLFSCHSREAEFFRGDREVCVQELTNSPARV